MSQRLPTPGGDSGTWGDVLNAYLGVTLAADGTLNAGVVPEAALALTDVTTANATTALHGLLPKLDGVSTHFLDGTGGYSVPAGSASDATVTFTDITTNNATTALHGFLKKLDGTATHFLDGTGAYSTPTGAGLSLSDVTTNNATTALHGFLPKLGGSTSQVLLGDGTWALQAPYSTNVQTAAYTAVLGDAGKILEVGVSSAATVTIPTNASVAFPVGTSIALFQQGAGQVTITPASGATILSASSKVKLTGQYSSAAIRKQLTDTWILAGDIA